MRKRIIVSGIALSLLATIPAWGQTSVIKREQPKTEQRKNVSVEDQFNSWFSSGSLTYYTHSDYVTVYHNSENKPKGNLDIPEYVTYKGKKYIVKEIGLCAFKGCDSLVSVVIPQVLTELDSEAFADCCRLSSVIISDGITNIPNAAFKNCEALVNVKIPQSVKSIGQNAFAGCKSLTEISLPPNIKNIGISGTFSGCEKLKKIDIPATVSEIGWSCFAGCTSLELIVIPDEVKKIGLYAFSRCGNLYSVSVPVAILDYIDPGTFYECPKLSYITVRYPDSSTKKVSLKEEWKQKL